MYGRLHFAVFLAFLHSDVDAATPAQWRGRSIYQIFTDRFARSDNSLVAECNPEEAKYCGGSWDGIIGRLDYIQGMGFDAIWISPVTKNIEGSTGYGEAYHGYWQQDLYSLNDNFGSSEDLERLSQAVHSRNMYLMVDVVVNHNGWNGSLDSIDFSVFKPFSKESDYNIPYCKINYNNHDNYTQLTKCWAGDQRVPLPDLKTTSERVRVGYNDWISNLVSRYSIDGLRLDTVPHVEQSFWKGFMAAAGGLYMLGEVYEANTQAACEYQKYLPGIMSYPIYFALSNAFASPFGDIPTLARTIGDLQDSCSDVSLLGSFSENHDVPRFPTKSDDIALAKNVLAFTVFGGGIPVLYQGQEQHFKGVGGKDPYNREALWSSGYDQNHELYRYISRLNQYRRRFMVSDAAFLSAPVNVIATDSHTLTIKRADLLIALSNRGSNGGNFSTSVPSGYDPGSSVIELVTCTTQVVKSGGMIDITISNGQPSFYYPNALTSTIC